MRKWILYVIVALCGGIVWGGVLLIIQHLQNLKKEGVKL